MTTAAKQPETLTVHQPEYQALAWQAYSLHELGMWVHLFAKRAAHRSPAAIDKRKKDLYDARNYLAMMQAHLAALDEETVVLENAAQQGHGGFTPSE